jgi:hypothetical protein
MLRVVLVAQLNHQAHLDRLYRMLVVVMVVLMQLVHLEILVVTHQ